MIKQIHLDTEDYKGTYKLAGGQLCFDFANTVSYRNRDAPHDWLGSYKNLVQWCEAVEILNEKDSKNLLNELLQDGKPIHKRLDFLFELREVIFRIFTDVAESKTPKIKDIQYINLLSSSKVSAQKVIFRDGTFHLEWARNLSYIDKILHEIYASVINVMMQVDLIRIKYCSSCGWLFHDTSRNKSRRWCVMEDCGNRDKVNRLNKKKRTKKTKL